MSRLPNPFRDDPGQQPKPQNKVDTPGFLLLAPPTGNNSFATLHGPGNNSPFNSGGDFIPFGNNKNDFSRRGNYRGSGNNSSPMHHTPGGFTGGGGNNRSPMNHTPGGFNGGGGNNRTPMNHTPGGFSGGGGNNRSSMYHTPGGFSGEGGNTNSPMHHTPGGFSGGGGRGGNTGGRNDFRGGNFNNSYSQSPYKQQGQNYSQSPALHNIRGQRHGFSNTPNNRNNRGRFNNGRSGGRGGKGPLSDIPIDKFVSDNMVKDPWSELESLKEATDDSKIPTSSSSTTSSKKESINGLDDSEIIIDSDTSAFIDNSYNDGIDSGTEGDSSPVHDTGSDSPYNVATSSTSEKDTGSDSDPHVDTYGEFQ